MQWKKTRESAETQVRRASVGRYARRRTAVRRVLGACCVGAGGAAPHVEVAAQPPLRGHPRAVEAAEIATLVDSAFAAGLPAEKLPGGVFVFVQHGRVVYAKGYGVSSLEDAYLELVGRKELSRAKMTDV